MSHWPCTNVHHNETSCKLAGLQPKDYCSNCEKNRLWDALNLLTDIRMKDPVLWDAIMQFRVNQDSKERI